MLDWAIEARGLTWQLTRAEKLTDVDRPASRLLVLAKWLAVGNDANGDGEISPVAGEGGALVAYQLAQLISR
jgi:hypothetical protein